MKATLKIILIFLAIFIFISACATFIPIGKYQNAYFKFVKDFRNKPEEHFNKEIEYANYIFDNGENPKTKRIKIHEKQNPKTQKEPTKMKPLYIRDKNNPEILHPYKEKKERKFLFFRIYYK